MALRYITVADLARIVGDDDLRRLTDDVDGSTVVTAVAERAIEDAADEVDMYLSARYSTPLGEPVPGPVRFLTTKLAVYRLHSRRRALEAQHPRRIDYDDAIAALEKISKGTASLGIEPPLASAADQIGEFTYSERLFTRDRLYGL